MRGGGASFITIPRPIRRLILFSSSFSPQFFPLFFLPSLLFRALLLVPLIIAVKKGLRCRGRGGVLDWVLRSLRSSCIGRQIKCFLRKRAKVGPGNKKSRLRFWGSLNEVPLSLACFPTTCGVMPEMQKLWPRTHFFFFGFFFMFIHPPPPPTNAPVKIAGFSGFAHFTARVGPWLPKAGTTFLRKKKSKRHLQLHELAFKTAKQSRIIFFVFFY